MSIAVLRVVGENLPNFQALAEDASKSGSSHFFMYETCSGHPTEVGIREHTYAVKPVHNGARTASHFALLDLIPITAGNFVTWTRETSVNPCMPGLRNIWFTYAAREIDRRESAEVVGRMELGRLKLPSVC